MYTCTGDHTCSRYCSKSRLFRLRANIGCPTFLVYEQLQCYHVNVYIYSRARKKTYKHIIFTLSCFLAHTNLSYRKIKIKRIRLVRLDLTLYLLYAIGPTSKPLHYSRRYCPTATHSGRYCPTATHSGHSISNNLISSYIRRKLAKTTNNRSEIKLAYATPFELQGQKNMTILRTGGIKMADKVQALPRILSFFHSFLNKINRILFII